MLINQAKQSKQLQLIILFTSCMPFPEHGAKGMKLCNLHCMGPAVVRDLHNLFPGGLTCTLLYLLCEGLVFTVVGQAQRRHNI